MISEGVCLLVFFCLFFQLISRIFHATNTSWSEITIIFPYRFWTDKPWIPWSFFPKLWNNQLKNHCHFWGGNMQWGEWYLVADEVSSMRKALMCDLDDGGRKKCKFHATKSHRFRQVICYLFFFDSRFFFKSIEHCRLFIDIWRAHILLKFWFLPGSRRWCLLPEIVGNQGPPAIGAITIYVQSSVNGIPKTLEVQSYFIAKLLVWLFPHYPPSKHPFKYHDYHICWYKTNMSTKKQTFNWYGVRWGMLGQSNVICNCVSVWFSKKTYGFQLFSGTSHFRHQCRSQQKSK